MFPHISIVINYLPPTKLVICFLLVGTAISLIACSISGKGIMLFLFILKPRYSKLSMAKNDFSALIFKPAAFSFFKTIFTLIRWSSKLPLLMINRSLI